ncbi:MAG: hypothetical protein JWL97_2273 [Gemmatimonadales bacterium]|jgi:hypothetical protein|nr:hypothetical protein [Gemmatimonadales bacterium]
MPITYSIDPTKQLVTSRLWGVTTEAQIREHDRSLRTDAAFNPGFRQLADMTELIESHVGSEFVNEASGDQFFNPGTPRAFVAPVDAIFGMARKFALQSEGVGQTIQVFRDMGSARKWLGLDD